MEFDGDPGGGGVADRGATEGQPRAVGGRGHAGCGEDGRLEYQLLKAGNGVAALCDDNLDTYWLSNGAQPHLVNIQFQKKVQMQLVVLYVDFKLDESYTPCKISIRAGDGFHNLKFLRR